MRVRRSITSMVRVRTRARLAAFGLVGAFGSLSLAGCGLSSSTVSIHYAADRNPAAVTGAGSVQVRVDVKDERDIRDRVGGKVLQSVPIYAANDVLALVGKSIEDELAGRGYRIGPGPVVVDVALEKFWNTNVTGWVGKSLGEVHLVVTVKDPSGNVLFSEPVVGASERSWQVLNEEDMEGVLEGALRQAVSKLMGNADFFTALGKAAGIS
jgi:uncharacterized lipoprotein YajG